MLFSDFSVWGSFNVVAVLMLSLLVAKILKKNIKILEKSLIPNSVLGGAVLVIVAFIYKMITGNVMFDEPIFGSNGTNTLEIITYHALALGFIASTFRKDDKKITKRRAGEVFDTGLTTVATYLLQAVVGLTVSIIAAYFIKGFFQGAGALLCFGYGQGTGQALNYGSIYEAAGFEGGRNFGLTIAALGFISASVGGVIHLEYLKKKGKISEKAAEKPVDMKEIQGENEIPMQESMDKLTVQVALIALAYFIAYGIMFVLAKLVPSMSSVIYGFNFLLGVLSATLVKAFISFLQKKKLVRREHINNFLMTRTSNFLFDLMVVAGVAAIRLDKMESYWGVLLIMGVLGLLVTFVYNRIIAKKLFPDYTEEQFLVMYGMLTGTASTGVILLREIDGDFSTPAAANIVYQNFPAIVFGLPMMILATMAPEQPLLVLIIAAVYFVILNILLFRRSIFRGKKRKNAQKE